MLNHLKNRRDIRAGGEAGFTTIELLVAMIILSIIMVPLAMSFYSSMSVADSTATQLRGSVARDNVATWFSRDVASVNASGVSVSPGVGGSGVCRDADTDVGSDYPFVSFTSTSLDASAPAATYRSTRATYWVTGAGEDASLVRVFCSDVNLDASTGLGAGRRKTLVARFGSDDELAAPELVHGPSVAGSITRSPCDEVACTIVVGGTAKFQVTAQRRVFGAGIPLEVGRLYSSSDTRYERFKLDGTASMNEGAWPGQISLGPGIDGPTSMKVEVAIQSNLGGSLQKLSNAAGVWEPTADGSTPDLTWLPMTPPDGTSAQWRLSLDSLHLPRGGEYNVWTRLTELSEDGSAEEPKEYGGSNGYPLWVDFVPDESVFVSATGDDGGDGLSPQTAVRTLTRAVVVANAAEAADPTHTRPEILLATAAPATDQHFGPAVLDTAASHRTLTGGYDSTTWKRRGIPSAVADAGDLGFVTPSERVDYLAPIVGDGAAANQGTGLLVSAAEELRIRQVGINSGVAPAGHDGKKGYSTYGMRVVSGGDVMLQNSTISAETGGAGKNGVPGVQPVGVALGSLGDGDTNAYESGPVYGCAGLRGKAKTTSATSGVISGCLGNRGGDGGRGGSGGGFFSSGGSGSTGGNGAGPNAGTGGGGGGGGYCITPNPGEGQRGLGAGGGGGGNSGGFESLDGTHLDQPNGVFGELWKGQDGLDGASGASGSGGGGGGGGGGTYCAGAAAGGSGPTGGYGGAGGGGAKGGGAGGGSFGLYVHGANSEVTLDFARLRSGPGGAGGTHANGARALSGGRGGQGYAQDKGGNTSGAGGGGGGGGGGGAAAGRGGASYAVVESGGGDVKAGAPGTSAIDVTNGAYGLTPAGVGAGGAAGRGGFAGYGVKQWFWYNFWTNYDTPNGTPGTAGGPGASSAARLASPSSCPSTGNVIWNGSNCVGF